MVDGEVRHVRAHLWRIEHILFCYQFWLENSVWSYLVANDNWNLQKYFRSES